ncbi:MAG: sensor histidine kinase [Planctomycetota bacterium]|jgi:PAS domain S-box-containing protein
MLGALAILAAGGAGEARIEAALLVAALLAVGLTALVAVLVTMLLGWRRRSAIAARRIVSALEQIRSGRTAEARDIEAGSPFLVVADAVERLGHEVSGRLRQVEAEGTRQRAIVDALQDSAVVTTDLDADILAFSAGAAATFGWRADEVVSRPLSLLFDEEAYKDFLPKLARRSLRERGFQIRSILARRDGAAFPADLAVSALRGSAPEPIGFLIVVRDVSQQVQLESRLRESEHRYRSLVDGLSEGVLIVRAGHLLYVNPAFAALCGLPADQLVGSRLRDRVATRDLMLIEERLAGIEGGGAAGEPVSCRLIDREGQLLAMVKLNATRIVYGGAPAVLLVVRDETTERRIESELRRNEARLDAVLEATSDGILALVDGPDGGRIQMTNRAFVKRFGLSSSQVLGADLRQLAVLIRRQGEWTAPVAELLGTAGSEARRELISLREHGELEVRVAPLTDRAGEPFGRVIAFRDLTEQRESERKLQLHAEQLQLSKVMLEQSYRKLDAVNKDLEARSEQLDQLNRELRKLDEMKSNLLGNVTHELQTPLVSIRGYTEMMQKERLGPTTEEQRRGLTLCLKNIDRLISLIDNLMVFTKSGRELGQLKLSRFELRAVVDEAAQLLSEKMRARQIRFSARFDATDHVLHADRDKIQQVFINLLSNAIKFNHDGGTVSIHVKGGPPGYVMVYVEDSGRGIPTEEQSRIFDRNYQVLRDASSTPEGSGIGLAIVRDILRLHGCRIGVESEEGRGTRFHFTLPLSEEADSTGEPLEPGSAPHDEPPERRSPEKEPAPRPRFRIIRRG